MKCPPENLSVESHDGFEVDSSEDFDLYIERKEYPEFRIDILSEVAPTALLASDVVIQEATAIDILDATMDTHTPIPEVYC